MIKKLNLLILTLIFTFITKIHLESYYCGVGQKTHNISSLPESNKISKALSDSEKNEYKPIDIYVDITNLKDDRYTTIEMIKTATEQCIQTLKKLIKVKPLNYKFYLNQSKIDEWGYSNIDEAVIDSSAGLNTDLLVIMQSGSHTYTGNSDIKYMDSDTKRPIVGIIEINSDFTFDYENGDQYMKSLLLHQFTHILGFLYDYFDYFDGGSSSVVYHNPSGRLDIDRYYIQSTKVKNFAKEYYNCDNLSIMPGVELENQDDKSKPNHWEARTLLGEYMNRDIYTPEQVISEFTLALLEDSGFYKVNYYTGGLMRFGKHKGCEFLTGACDNVPNSKNEFFYIKDNDKPSCSSGRQSRTYEMYTRYIEIPIKYDVFNGPGGIEYADYCLGMIPFNLEEGERTFHSYYVGNCKLANTNYGQYITYNNNIRVKNSNFPTELKEQFGTNSFCVLTSVSQKNGREELKFTSGDGEVIHPMCYLMYCSEKSLTIQIYNQFIVCPRSGGRIVVNNTYYEGHLYCPDYNLICTGTVICNDMFDCVKNESRYKENTFTYDYEILTSQIITELKLDTFIKTGCYELSDDGKCPKFCEACNEYQRCFQCNSDHEPRIGVKEDDETTAIKCYNGENLTIGYYLNNDTGIYYPCTEFCNKCDKYRCYECQKYTKPSEDNTTCIEIVKHCGKYNEKEECTKCKEGYAFLRTDRTICYELNTEINTTKHYTDDNGISYYPCNESIEKCSECNEKSVCKRCEKDYYFIKEVRNKCETGYDLKEYYTNDDGISYYPCYTDVNQCKKCYSQYNCYECQINHFFIKYNRSHCFGDEIDKRQYYTLDEGYSYFPCNEAMNNCLECEFNTSCEKCYNYYYFLKDDRKTCYNNLTLINYYTEDNGTSYWPCDTYFTNCSECSDKNTCTKCKTDNGFIKNVRTKCEYIPKNKYYTEDGISYWPCDNNLPNCDECNNKNECTKCKASYNFMGYDRTQCYTNLDDRYFIEDDIYWPCNTTVSNCKNCYSRRNCSKCNDSYFFIKLQRDKCYSETDIDKKQYYTLDGGDSYFPCKEAINNCLECDQPFECNKCNPYYYFLKSDRKTCINNLTLINYYTEDGGISYWPCDTYLTNCSECSDRSTCKRCKTDNGFIKNDRQFCLYIPKNKYYTEDGGISYWPCDTNITNCDECESKTRCTKCIPYNYFIGNDRSVCYNNIDKDRYFTKDNITYWPCNSTVRYCDTCKNETYCTKCVKDYYFLGYNKERCRNDIDKETHYTTDDITYFPCSEAMNNCEKCNDPNICLKCKNNFYFVEEQRDECYDIKDFKKYFTENNGTSYIPCSKAATHCDECYKRGYCVKCINDYALVIDKTDECKSIADINETHFKYNETHYQKCDSVIKDCSSCSSADYCTKCIDNFYFVDENYKLCVDNDSIVPKEEYYKVDDKNYYSCGYTKGVENCRKCRDLSYCYVCKSDYALVNDIYSKCHSKKDLEKGYYSEDGIMYYPCIKNCDKCINDIECQECAENYDLISQNTNCGKCQVQLINTNQNLDTKNLNTLVNNYLKSNTENIDVVYHYINENNNFTITVFKTYECTKSLIKNDYFEINTKNLTLKLNEKLGTSLNDYTYYLITNNGKSMLETVDTSSREKINLNNDCPECINENIGITNNYTSEIHEYMGNVCLNKIKSNNIDIFEQNDNYYKKICKNFTLGGIDIPIKERRKNYYLGDIANELVCTDPNCEIVTKTLSNLTGNCFCPITTDLNYIINAKKDSKIDDSFYKKTKMNNFKIFACYNEGMDPKNLGKNAGFIVFIVFIVLQILCFIAFLVCKNSSGIVYKQPLKKSAASRTAAPPRKTDIKNIAYPKDCLFIDNFDKLQDINDDICVQDGEKEIQPRDDEELVDEEFTEEEEYEESEYPETRKKFDLKKKYNNNDTLNFDEEEKNSENSGRKNLLDEKSGRKKLKFKQDLLDKDNLNKNDKNLGNNIKTYVDKGSEGQLTANDLMNNSSENKNSISSKEEAIAIRESIIKGKDFMTYFDAKNKKKLTFCGFYCFLLGLRQPIFRLLSFITCLNISNSYVSVFIHLIDFLFGLSMNLFFNALHLGQKYFQKKYEHFDKKYNLRFLDDEDMSVSSTEIFAYAMKNVVGYAVISFILCFVIQEIIYYFLLSLRRKITELIKNEKNQDILSEEIKNLLKTSKISYGYMFFINIVLMLLFYYYIANFCGVYKGGVADLFAGFLWTFIFMQIIPFIICFIFALFRYSSLLKNNEKLYGMSNYLIY